MTPQAGRARGRIAPGPAGPEEILDLPVHRVTMEWPEALAVLRGRGVRTGQVGGRSLGRLPDGRDLAEAICRATRWRPR